MDFVLLGLPSAQISYIPAALGLQTPTLTPAGEQRYFEYPLTPQPISTAAAAAGPLGRDSLLQRSKIRFLCFVLLSKIELIQAVMESTSFKQILLLHNIYNQQVHRLVYLLL